MKYAILENLSTTTKIESLLFFDIGKLKTKFIKIYVNPKKNQGWIKLKKIN
jgi:hypothetical protein